MTRRPKRLTSPLMGRWEPARPSRLAFQAAELLVANAAGTGAPFDRATLRTLREGQFWQRRDADVRAMGPALARRAVRERLERQEAERQEAERAEARRNAAARAERLA